MTGVSTDIGTSFVRPGGRVGDVLHAKAVLTGMGAFGFYLPGLRLRKRTRGRETIGLYPGGLYEPCWRTCGLWM